MLKLLVDVVSSVKILESYYQIYGKIFTSRRIIEDSFHIDTTLGRNVHIKVRLPKGTAENNNIEFNFASINGSKRSYNLNSRTTIKTFGLQVWLCFRN